MSRKDEEEEANVKTEVEAEEEIQMRNLYPHRVRSPFEEMSRHFTDKWQFKALNQFRRGPSADN